MNEQTTTTNNGTEESDDIAIVPQAESSEAIPAGAYIASLVGFHIELKPAWKIEQQAKNNPDKEIDDKQYRWSFELSEGEYQGKRLATWENRSWHENSNSGKIVRALLDVDTLPTGMTTKQLLGLKAQIWVIEKNERNYISKVLPVPKKKIKPPSDDPIPTEAELEARYKKAWGQLDKEERRKVMQQVGTHDKFPTMPRAAMWRIVSEMEAAVQAADPNGDFEF